MLIHEITLRGILSFGPDTPPLPMQPLNVLIGPNGSGKSNLISAIDFMRSSPSKLSTAMRGPGIGGVTEWICKGSKERIATVGITFGHDANDPLRHEISFGETASRFILISEQIIAGDKTQRNREIYSTDRDGDSAVIVRNGEHTKLKLSYRDESVLSQRKDPEQYPELMYLADSYGEFKLYREWTFGRNSICRTPQPADAPSDRLEEDFSNLGLFLNHLRSSPKAKNEIVERLRDLYEGLDDFDVRIKGGTVEIFLTEQDFIVPASRLSDGTIRYLCLLAILCDPDPPALICIEEPELGLHPDLIPKIADLLVAASQRTQLIVTTHSDILIDALTEQPESVVVMEKKDGKTTATRLQASEELQGWLQSYRLGQLWMRGAIGGTRW